MDEIIQIAKASYNSFVRVTMEFTEMLYFKKDTLHKMITINGLEHYREAKQEGKGVFLFSAHFGNWELGNAALALMTGPFYFVYRILDSPFLEKGITDVRASCGVKSLSKEHAMRPMMRLLKQNKTISLLIDQNVAVYDGIFIDFFGRPACTTSGLALLALHSGVPVLPVFTTRMPDGKYTLEIGSKVDIIDTGNRSADMLINTQNFSKIIEDHIRKYPEQWFWMHQRWKTKLCQAR